MEGNTDDDDGGDYDENSLSCHSFHLNDKVSGDLLFSKQKRIPEEGKRRKGGGSPWFRGPK